MMLLWDDVKLDYCLTDSLLQLGPFISEPNAKIQPQVNDLYKSCWRKSYMFMNFVQYNVIELVIKQ